MAHSFKTGFKCIIIELYLKLFKLLVWLCYTQHLHISSLHNIENYIFFHSFFLNYFNNLFFSFDLFSFSITFNILSFNLIFIGEDILAFLIFSFLILLAWGLVTLCFIPFLLLISNNLTTTLCWDLKFIWFSFLVLYDTLRIHFRSSVQ